MLKSIEYALLLLTVPDKTDKWKQCSCVLSRKTHPNIYHAHKPENNLHFRNQNKRKLFDY